MSNVRFELDITGLQQLMKSDGMQNALENAAQAVKRQAGGGYGTNTHVASFVAISNVYPITKRAQRSAMNNALLKAASAVGLRMEK